MSTPLLRTKLYIPQPGPRTIPRRRLVDRLEESSRRKLTLISAPAGFGKTTLVSEWLGEAGRPAAWVSLDETDNDLSRFLSYLIAGLQTLEPDVGSGVAGVLQLPRLSQAESLLTALLNDLSSLDREIVLVLDDYHL